MHRSKLAAWFVATLSFSLLFYRQSLGVNVLLINLLLIALTFICYPALRTHRAVVTLAAGCLLTAVNVAIHPTGAAVVMNVVSLSGLSGLCHRPTNALVVAWVHGAYSFLATGVRYTLGRFLLPRNTAESSPTPVVAGVTTQQVIALLAPALLVSLFFTLYWQASPAFAGLFAGLSLDFISFPWVFFTLFGAYLAVVFFYPLVIPRLAQADRAAPDTLVRRQGASRSRFNVIGIRYEHRTAWRAFVLLNVLLFLVNAVDVGYLVAGRLPESTTHKEFLHQGVHALIASVVLAIAVVMYFFRSNLNFLSTNQPLKYAVYAWIAQNAMLVVTTAVKNAAYIDQFGLTHRRVGVYVYLLLTLVGLALTGVKVRDAKSNWFLLRRNGWAFYAVLVAYSLIDWSRMITHYNLARLDEHPTSIYYLLQLSDANLDLLASVQHASSVPAPVQERIGEKIYYFVKREAKQDWPSWNYRDYHLHQKLIQR